MHIFFPNQQKTINAPAGATIAEACAIAGVSLNTACGGKGNCGKCSVLIKSGNLTMEVLACQYNVSDNMSVYTEESESAKILSDSVTVKPLNIDPPVMNYPVAKCALDDFPQANRIDALNTLLPITISDPNGVLTSAINDNCYKSSSVLNILISENVIIDINLKNGPTECFGMAFDIGTTTVVGYLYDLYSAVRLYPA